MAGAAEPGAKPVQYQKGGFEEGDQERVAELMKALDRRGCFVLASNAETPLVRRLYADFNVERIEVLVRSVAMWRAGGVPQRCSSETTERSSGE